MRALTCILLIALAGCGNGSLRPVEGIVTLDGKPIDNVIVSFSPESGGTSGAGVTDAQGKFTLSSALGRGLPEGNYLVAISEQSTVDDSEPKFEEGSNSAAYEQMAVSNAKDYKQAQKKSRIPEKYDSKSELRATVDATKSKFDFDLKSK